METQTTQGFESWSIVELFGKQKIAGLVTEATIGGCSLLRVDVPAVGEQPAYTRYFGQGAIYSLTPVSEEIARSALEYIRPRPVQAYMLPSPKSDDAGEEKKFPYRHSDWDGADDDDDDGDDEDEPRRDIPF